MGEGQGGEVCVRRGESGAKLEAQLEEGVVAERRKGESGERGSVRKEWISGSLCGDH